MSDLKNIEIFLVPLQNLGTWCGGGTPSKQVPAYWENGTIPWVSPKDMKVEHIRRAEDSITEKAVKESSTNLLPAGSVLVVTRSGILRHTFPVAVTDLPVTINQDLKALVPNEGVDPKYVAFALRAFNREILNQCSKQGTTVNSIETKELLRFQIPLFSTEVQTRIVAEIEKQFSRLDEAVANLKRVKANLKRYKAAVLKAAVEGKLTEEWRKNNPDVEPADKLLERILAERRKTAGKGKYKEPVSPDASRLPEVPVGWVWASWESVLDNGKEAFKRGPFGSALKKSIFVESGYKVYEQYCPINDDPSFARYYIDETKFREMEGFSVKARDFLISCSGVTLGRITQIPDDFEPGVINQALLRVRINKKFISDSFFLAIFRSPFFQKQIFDNSQGAAIPNVKGVAELKAISIPLPPLEEQNVFVQKIDEQLSIIAESERQIGANICRAGRLRQSILKQAFSGQLAPHDPEDEPASVMLERLRAAQPSEAKDPAPHSRRPRTSAPKTRVPSPEPLPLVAEASASYGAAIAARILAAMQSGREYTRADLVEPLGLTTGQWNAAIQELKRQGKVRQVGEKRGARYLVSR